MTHYMIHKKWITHDEQSKLWLWHMKTATWSNYKLHAIICNQATFEFGIKMPLGVIRCHQIWWLNHQGHHQFITWFILRKLMPLGGQKEAPVNNTDNHKVVKIITKPSWCHHLVISFVLLVTLVNHVVSSGHIMVLAETDRADYISRHHPYSAITTLNADQLPHSSEFLLSTHGQPTSPRCFVDKEIMVIIKISQWFC